MNRYSTIYTKKLACNIRRLYTIKKDRSIGNACGILVVIAVMLPQRGNQQGVAISTDVRIGLIQTGLRMIRTHPVFGIGLAEFYPRSAEYSSPELLAKFPAIAARGENSDRRNGSRCSMGR